MLRQETERLKAELEEVRMDDVRFVNWILEYGYRSIQWLGAKYWVGEDEGIDQYKTTPQLYTIYQSKKPNPNGHE
jgi:hypothetical protein